MDRTTGLRVAARNPFWVCAHCVLTFASFAEGRRAAPAKATAPPTFGLGWPTVRFGTERFQVRMPPEWVPIPDMHVKGMLTGATARSFNQDLKSGQDYRFGFQESPVGEWFHGAYFLVDKQFRRRWTMAELSALPRIETVMPDGMPFRSDGTRGAFSRSRAGSCFFEPEMRIVWLNLGTGRQWMQCGNGVAAIFLTQRGRSNSIPMPLRMPAWPISISSSGLRDPLR